MFDPYCASCRTRVLLGFRQLRSLASTREGIVLRFTCSCGGEAVLVTGRLADRPVVSNPASAESSQPLREAVPSPAGG